MTGYLIVCTLLGVIVILLGVIKGRGDRIKELEYERDYLFNELHKKVM